MANPLIVDGPLKGKDFPLSDEIIEQGSFQYDLPQAMTLGEGGTIATGVSGGRVTYRRHYYGILGHRLMIFSLARDFQSISFQDLRDLFDIVISERGKEAEHRQ